MRTITAPFSYYGGKRALAERIIDLFPPHDVFVDVFGGSGAIVLNKIPASIDVYNDISGHLVNFFQVLRDPVMSEKLLQQLRLTPTSRDEYYNCYKYLKQTPTFLYANQVEWARAWFAYVQQSFSSIPRLHQVSGWGYGTTKSNNVATSFVHSIEKLPEIIRRCRMLQVDHRSFERIITAYDTPQTLLYCDPPYVMSTRKKEKCYQDEMTDTQHSDLLISLKNSRSMVILSGYRSELYDSHLADWRRIDIESSVGINKGKREPRMECIWIKPNSEKQATLFDVVTA